MIHLSAVLMVFSGISHNMPLLRGKKSSREIGAGIFGIFYLLIGAGLFFDVRAAYMAGAVIPLTGLVLGSVLYIRGDDRSKITLMHLVIDVVVVVACIRYLFFNNI